MDAPEYRETSYTSLLKFAKDVNSFGRLLRKKSINGIQYFRFMFILCFSLRGSPYSMLCDSLPRSQFCRPEGIHFNVAKCAFNTGFRGAIG